MTTTRTLTLLTLSLSASFGASLPSTSVVAPTAVARIAGGDYCFVHSHRIEVEKQAPSWLVLKLRVQVAYHNPGTRPLIIPIGHERTVYTALRPGVMKTFKELPTIEGLNPSLKPMEALPPKVSPDNPVDPKNDYFAIIPPNGNYVASTLEDIYFPVNHKTLIRHDPDLRGKKLYLRVQLDQQDMNPSLVTELSDRWSKFGVPWTGSLMTNVMTINVPQNPAPSGVCNDGPFETPGNAPSNPGK